MKTGSFKELSNLRLVKKGFAVFLFLLYVFYIDHCALHCRVWTAYWHLP